MLFVQFYSGDHRYALPANRVEAVLPLAGLQKLSRAADFVAGLLNYRGRAVPVFDLNRLLLGRWSREQLSTRILILKPGAGDVTSDDVPFMGAIVEAATDTLCCGVNAFKPAGIDPGLPFLGNVLADKSGMTHLVDVDHLLSLAGDSLHRSPRMETP